MHIHTLVLVLLLYNYYLLNMCVAIIYVEMSIEYQIHRTCMLKQNEVKHGLHHHKQQHQNNIGTKHD